ncbi:MAG: hypothetical protein RL344_170 [Pseudomonadota bacterium]|jgi:hypothetical protein
MYHISTFQLRHIALLCKCTGGSLISGSVNNGFFDRHIRSLIVATIGISLFIIGNFIDEYLAAQGDAPSESVLDILLISIFLSLGIGFFTGAIQHITFPKVPIASWVTPLGLILTIAGLGWKFKDNRVIVKLLSYYTIITTVLVTGISLATFHWVDRTPLVISPVVVPTIISQDQAFLNSLEHTRLKAELVLKNSPDAKVRSLAQTIIKTY